MNRLQASSYSKRPELSRDDLMRLKWLLGALIALTSLTSVWFFELPGGVILFPVVVVVMTAAIRPDLVLRVPAWVWKLGFPALATGLLIDYLLNGSVLEALLRLNVMLIALRAVSPRERRDDLQLLVLSLFLVVMAGVLTVSIGFALLITVFAGLGLAFLMLVTLCHKVGREVAVGDQWTHATWRAVLSRAISLADWRFIGMSAGMFVSAIVITSVLFLAIPRFEIGSSLGLLGLKNKRSLSGFSDSITFGDVTDIKQDDSTALRVETSDPGSVPAVPYWRMVVLDSYEDGRFRVSQRARNGSVISERGSFTVPGTLPESEGAIQWTFYLEPGISRYLPVGGRFAAIRLRETTQVIQNPFSGVVALGLEPQKMFAYRVDGMEFSGRIPDPSRTELARVNPTNQGRATSLERFPPTLTQLDVNPAERAALETIVAEITGGKQVSAEEFSRLALGYLSSRHSYSLTSSLPPGDGDPLVKWLGSNTPGHCEFFAGAFTLLARAAGYRTRVVVGFSGGTWNSYEGYFMVRNSDAHAWTEIHDGDEWIRVDPTPGAAGLAESGEAMQAFALSADRSWSAYLDSLRVLWYRRVVNFDDQQQLEVAETVKTMTRRSGERLLGLGVIIFERIDAWLKRPWKWQRITGTAIIAISVVLAIAVVWRTRHRWLAKLRFSREADPIRARAGVWLSRLQVAGALGLEPDVTTELQRVRFGPSRLREYPVELFKSARRVIRLSKKIRRD